MRTLFGELEITAVTVNSKFTIFAYLDLTQNLQN